MKAEQTTFPFSAIVGQDKMKKALLLNIINPKLGGVLVRGEKGTAKSTAVRAMANLLPEIEVVADCPCGCDAYRTMQLCPMCSKIVAQGGELTTTCRKIRVVDLPVGSTEDRVLGTLDLEKAIKEGEKHFEPGILAEAHRGILYVDEVNLLDDHIVDVLLDAAAMGVNAVEREGISFTHPAEFVLVGTMNPEEGELRPQLLDRFGLCVQIEGLSDLDQRVEVVKRRAAFEENPEGFFEQWRPEEEKLSKQIVAAKELLPRVTASDDILKLIAEIAIDMQVDGHRADIVMMKAAKALAAFDGRSEVVREDILEASEMGLPHRMRKKPFQKIGVETEKLKRIVAG
ncbi:MAG: ATP-binding protein [Deltaproteobacteria bacterium]|nr:ATP-binding protein [Deltaproteobacteria bacterium]